MRNFVGTLLLLFLSMVFSGCGGQAVNPPDASLDKPLPTYEPQHAKLTPDQKYLERMLTKNGYSNGSKPTIVVVHKLSRRLTLYHGITPLKTYKIVLGNDPYNDKLCQGDTCTPEGVYHVVTKYPHPRWDHFILLDYPNTQNWLKFARAKKAGKVPATADIGGSIGIHGTEDPSRNLSGMNWTKGCISLLNRDLEEIYPMIDKRTLVVINK
jgi:murein L,D-transpeptidase YafK